MGVVNDSCCSFWEYRVSYVSGCDCFLDKYTATKTVLARGVRQFDIKVDSCVPRELPLPKKRDQPIINTNQ